MGSKSSQPAARLGDIDTGHPGAGPTPIITGSSDVKTNNKPAGRLGDKLKKHHKGTRVIVEGSGSVLINGRPAARVTDAINCGGVMNKGSSNVLIGDKPQLQGSKDIIFKFNRATGTNKMYVANIAPEKIPFSQREQVKVKTLAAKDKPVEEEEFVIDLMVEAQYDLSLGSMSDTCQLWTIDDNGGVYKQSIGIQGNIKSGPKGQFFSILFTTVIPDHYYSCVIDRGDGESVVVFDDKLITESMGILRKK